ncbi:hypothetical protein K0M31_002394 [Melipona bicolor]|uniref:Uncharacterized protein n=1 Tax=Melipona bicolor TaxID=60889 RepID=A0AA40KYM2_9HYME|nr:hypothetical protein K0M31_002394 [Melipona bicolor]
MGIERKWRLCTVSGTGWDGSGNYGENWNNKRCKWDEGHFHRIGTQPRLQYKHSHDVDPSYSISRAMRQSSKAINTIRQHPLSYPLEGKDIVRVRRTMIPQILVSNTRLAQAASGCAPSVDALPIFDVKQQSVRNPARMGGCPTSLVGLVTITGVWGKESLPSAPLEMSLRQ